jgi:hypothetical protein
VIWSDESSFTLFPTLGRVYIWRAPEEAYNPECLVPTVKHVEDSVVVWAAILWYLVSPFSIFHDRITAREYVDRLCNLAHPIIQSLFPNNDAVFQDDNAPTHIAGTVHHSWFEERVGELHHLSWPEQLSHEPLWSVLETNVRNRFPPPTSLKQFEDVLQEEWHKFRLETVENVYESIPKRIAAVLKAKDGPTPYQ